MNHERDKKRRGAHAKAQRRKEELRKVFFLCASAPLREVSSSFVYFVSFVVLFFALPAAAADRPNILWITAEDMSPDLGCYGVEYASTPNLDRLASQGVRYTNAFATIGVCAPARSTIITGMYPPSIGTQHMRCQGRLPEFIKCFPEYLRNAGYYCTNNSKEDYNFKAPKTAWDQSNGKAHWRNRPQADQPFFAVFNLTVTHESRTWPPAEAPLGDLARVPIPPYHPDTPEVRRDWADYHANISVMDGQVAAILQQLEADGLAEETIVFFYSDHGAGMPRSKRWLYDSSLRVPLIVRFPEKYKHLAPTGAGAAGSTVDRLVSFVDLAPTVLSLAGVDVPDHMQGSAFLGKAAGEPRKYIHGFRDRMDERYDMIRCVRDERYKYIRNFQPHKPYFHAQYLEYANRMPTLRIWQELSRAGKLDEVQAQWMGSSKPPEELYDTQADPWETKNLADSPEHRSKLEELRAELRRWMIDIKDLGLLPESDMRTRFGDRTPYEGARQEPKSFDAEELLTATEAFRNGKSRIVHGNPDPAVRWWDAVALNIIYSLSSGHAGSDVLVRQGMKDRSPEVRIEYAEIAAKRGHAAEALPVLEAALKHENEWVRVRAANAIDNLDAIAAPLRQPLQAAVKDKNEYVARSAEHALEGLD